MDFLHLLLILDEILYYRYIYTTISKYTNDNIYAFQNTSSANLKILHEHTFIKIGYSLRLQ